MCLSCVVKSFWRETRIFLLVWFFLRLMGEASLMEIRKLKKKEPMDFPFISLLFLFCFFLASLRSRFQIFFVFVVHIPPPHFSLCVSYRFLCYSFGKIQPAVFCKHKQRIKTFWISMILIKFRFIETRNNAQRWERKKETKQIGQKKKRWMNEE